MGATNWAERGLEWTTENVKTDDGATTLVGAEIPVIVDYVKLDTALRAAGGSLIHVVNASNSPRVMAQAKKRNNSKVVGEALRDMVWIGLLGMRAPRNVPTTVTVTVTVVTSPLPDGTLYTGTDRVEYMQLAIAALVDRGLDVAMARGIAENMANSIVELK